MRARTITFNALLTVLTSLMFISFSDRANAQCTANYSITYVDCSTILVYDSSTAASGDTIDFVNIDWGDGEYASAVQPGDFPSSHTYDSTGTYTYVHMIVTTLGCSNIASGPVIINISPIADFSTSAVCLGYPHPFTDLSTSNGGSSITNWFWDFGDGGSSTSQHPAYTFSAPGFHTVCLTVSNADGCSDTVCYQVEVYSEPEAFFSASPAYNSDSVCFTDQSLNNGFPIISWDWDFGDGGTSTQQNPCHQYPASGTYNVTLTVVNNMGCSDNTTMQVEVYQNPVANFSTSPVCDGYLMCFVDLSIANAATIQSWVWDFGDGGTSTQQNPCHQYPASGTYNVTLTVVNSMGFSDDTMMQVEVYQNPVADFTDSSCCTFNVFFTDLSIANASGIAAWLWNFGDGGSSTYKHPVHTYPSAGNYNVCLIVVNNNGCIDSLCRIVIVPESVDIASNVVNDAVISIYPNPANTILNLKTTEVVDQLRILDLNGRSIDLITTESAQNSFSTSELINGIYILEITSGNNIIQKKFVIHH